MDEEIRYEQEQEEKRIRAEEAKKRYKQNQRCLKIWRNQEKKHKKTKT